MRRGWIWLIVGGLLALFILLFVVLYLLGGPEQSPLERVRDIAVIFLALTTVLVVLLLGVLVGVAIWLGLLIRDHLIPLLAAATETMTKAKGTVEFVGETVARPIIRTYGRVAALRALLRTLTHR
ncbi:hypothetical protein NET03_05345 [Thermomicrobium sp. CFH 73360]|uniref:hypothetical protein n=1 Tax=Thermomicrobium sp. CFH 73360 TaxID=2951987 RepID=UPI002076E55D|nr:hypothetical protein [Thermomicrobium sp. CFH 73360]MCM8745950.1 hypothetical protein [Thermomicrobium sp. CFH 73360]